MADLMGIALCLAAVTLADAIERLLGSECRSASCVRCARARRAR